MITIANANQSGKVGENTYVINLSGGHSKKARRFFWVIRPGSDHPVRRSDENEGKNPGLCEEKTHGYGRGDYRRIAHKSWDCYSFVEFPKGKRKVRATDSWPTKYMVLPRKPVNVNNGQDFDFMDYVKKLNRENQELKAENNRLRGELNEYRGKLARLAQRIVRQNIYGNH